MKFYLRVYKTLIRMNFSRLTVYRANFINSIISSTVWGFFSFSLILLFTSQTKTIHGWTSDELILLMALYNIVIGGFFHGFFTRNFDKMSTLIDLGQLDSILLKPIDSQFFLSTQVIGFTQISRVLMGLIVAVYIINKIHLTITLFSLLLFVLLSVLGILILYSIWFSVLTITIWFTKLSNLLDLLYHLNDLSRFPPQMYKALKNYAFFILPYTFILITPAKVILNRLTFADVGGMLFFAVALFYFSRKFWKFALRYYTSASS